MKRVSFLVGFTVVSLSFFASDVFGADGFGASATGGAGGETVTVSTAEDFQYYIESDETYIVQVSGTIDLGTIGGKIRIHSNKTIRGIDSDPTIIGNLAFQSGTSNVIIERLNITNPDNWGEGDGITVKYATDIFITKCTFYDCPDGCLDITRESDYITVSWCKFHYTFAFAHRYVNLIGGDDGHTGDMGKLHITFHHNWWSTLCDSRMPSVRYGRVHVYNNYYDCPGNSYCIAARLYSECLIENNYFDNVNNPYSIWISSGEDGKIGASGNIFESCGGYTDPGDDDIFTPPYSYTLDNAEDVPSIVMAGAGATPAVEVYYVDTDATGNNDGSSWHDAFNHLQDAIAPSPLGSEIWVAEGVYKPDEDTAHPGGTGSRDATFQFKNGVAIYGGYAGFGKPEPDARDIDLYETILSGDLNGDDGPNFANNGENSYHVVTSIGTGETTVLDGFTITAGNANGPEEAAQNLGGGMFSFQSSLTLINCKFIGNSAEYSGGMFNEGGSPTVTNCIFSDNSAEIGGGMFNYESRPTLTNCTFNNNSAEIIGGGMFNYENSPTLTNCTFSDNSAWAGGGMCNSDSSPKLTNCTFSGNTASSGGGMYSEFRSLTLTNCTFSNNSAEIGGGMFISDSSPTVTNCILWGNTASSGSQIYNDGTSSTTVTYSDVQGGYTGEGNIDTDPLFVAPDSNDFHLLPSSPCINAGDPEFVPEPGETDIDGELRVMLGRVDMGADEFNPFEIEFIVVNKRRIGRTIFEYDCSASLHNISRFDVENIQLEIVKTPKNMKIIDPNVTFGNIMVGAGQSVISIDTCTFEVDRAQSIEPMEIIWWSSCDLVATGQAMQHSGSSIVFLEEDVISGDLTGERKVDFADLAVLAEQWLGPQGTPSADIAPSGGDGIINFLDFAELAENWQKE